MVCEKYRGGFVKVPRYFLQTTAVLSLARRLIVLKEGWEWTFVRGGGDQFEGVGPKVSGAAPPAPPRRRERPLWVNGTVKLGIVREAHGSF